MIKSEKYTQNPIYLAGKPLPIEVNIPNTGRKLFDLYDGSTKITSLPLISDYNGTNYRLLVNKPILDYMTNQEMPDSTIIGFFTVENFVKTITVKYQSIGDTSQTTAQTITVVNCNGPYYLVSSMLYNAINFYGLYLKYKEVSPDEQQYLYFLNNLVDNPTQLVAKVIAITKDNKIIKAERYIEPAANTLYGFNASPQSIAHMLGVSTDTIAKYSVQLQDDAGVKLTDIAQYKLISPTSYATTIAFLNSLGVWDFKTFLGQNKTQRENDSPKSEANLEQIELYTHSFKSIELNSGVLEYGMKQYLEYQLTHSKDIRVLEDGAFRPYVKTFKNISSFDSLENNEVISIQLRSRQTDQ